MKNQRLTAITVLSALIWNTALPVGSVAAQHPRSKPVKVSAAKSGSRWITPGQTPGTLVVQRMAPGRFIQAPIATLTRTVIPKANYAQLAQEMRDSFPGAVEWIPVRRGKMNTLTANIPRANRVIHAYFREVPGKGTEMTLVSVRRAFAYPVLLEAELLVRKLNETPASKAFETLSAWIDWVVPDAQADGLNVNLGGFISSLGSSTNVDLQRYVAAPLQNLTNATIGLGYSAEISSSRIAGAANVGSSALRDSSGQLSGALTTSSGQLSGAFNNGAGAINGLTAEAANWRGAMDSNVNKLVTTGNGAVKLGYDALAQGQQMVNTTVAGMNAVGDKAVQAANTLKNTFSPKNMAKTMFAGAFAGAMGAFAFHFLVDGSVELVTSVFNWVTGRLPAGVRNRIDEKTKKALADLSSQAEELAKVESEIDQQLLALSFALQHPAEDLVAAADDELLNAEKDKTLAKASFMSLPRGSAEEQACRDDVRMWGNWEKALTNLMPVLRQYGVSNEASICNQIDSLLGRWASIQSRLFQARQVLMNNLDYIMGQMLKNFNEANESEGTSWAKEKECLRPAETAADNAKDYMEKACKGKTEDDPVCRLAKQGHFLAEDNKTKCEWATKTRENRGSSVTYANGLSLVNKDLEALQKAASEFNQADCPPGVKDKVCQGNAGEFFKMRERLRQKVNMARNACPANSIAADFLGSPDREPTTPPATRAPADYFTGREGSLAPQASGSVLDAFNSASSESAPSPATVGAAAAAGAATSGSSNSPGNAALPRPSDIASAASSPSASGAERKPNMLARAAYGAMDFLGSLFTFSSR